MKDNDADFEEQNSMQQSTINNLQHNFTDSSSSQASLPNGATREMLVDSIADIDKKIQFWKKFSLIIGLITFFGYIIVLIGTNVSAHGIQFGWAVFMMFGMAWQGLIFALFVLSLISLIRVVVLSNKRKKHVFKDYAMVAIGLLLIFSPYAISGVLSFFRISWNEDNSVSVTLKSKDPYYLSGDSSWAAWNKCAKGGKTSNDLKNVNVDDYYSYIDDTEERKLFAAQRYVKQIGEEIVCQVGEFYKENGRYPNKVEIDNFSSNAINDDVKKGIYNIKPEVGDEPNEKDFTVLFDKDCTNKTIEDGNIVVLSPLYGDSGRFCVYNDIDEVLESF